MIVLRTYAHETITEMAQYAAVPVINALSDLEHPCQALADFMTLEERFGTARGLKFTYVGDGNNVCHSLMLTAALLGAHCIVATPKNYSPKAEIVAKAQDIRAKPEDRSRSRKMRWPLSRERMRSTPMSAPAWASSTKRPSVRLSSSPTR